MKRQILFRGLRVKAPTRGASLQRKETRSLPSLSMRHVRRVGYVLVTLALVLGGAQLAQAVWQLPVSRVVVNGEFRQVDKPAIVDAVQPLLDEGFIALDLDRIRRQLQQRPWVFDVDVTRRWPSEIVISVQEQTVIARWGDRGFLNFRGELFLPEQTDMRWIDRDSLPLLDGPEGSAERVMSHFRQLSDALSQQGLALNQLALNDRGSWEVTLGSGTEVLLGNDDIMGKMRRFLQAHRGVLAQRFDQAKSIDMRYSRGFAVAWDKEDKRT